MELLGAFFFFFGTDMGASLSSALLLKGTLEWPVSVGPSVSSWTSEQ